MGQEVEPVTLVEVTGGDWGVEDKVITDEAYEMAVLPNGPS